MAITTMQGAISGAQWLRLFCKLPGSAMTVSRIYSLWGYGGMPPAGGYDTTLNGVTLSSSSAQVTGQIDFRDPLSGNTYLARFASATQTAMGQYFLCDRIWHNGGFDVTNTGAQSITSPTWPSRDMNGATSGLGVMLGLEISGAAGAAAPTITCSYTNSAGTSGQTATNLFATANSPIAGTFYPMQLATGDFGVHSVQSLTLNTSWLSGTMNLVAYRVLQSLECRGDLVTTYANDPLTGGLPRLYNGSVPFILYIPGTSAAITAVGQIQWTQG